MKPGSPSRFDRRIGTLTLLVALFVLGFVLAFDSWVEIRSRQQALAATAARTRMLEERAAAITRTAPDAQGNPAIAENWSLGGDTAGLASAEFQRSLAVLAERSGAFVRTLDMRESDSAGDAETDRLVRLRLEADMEVIEQKLPDLLYAVETSLPLMVVDSLTLRPNRAISAGPVADADRPLNLRLAVSAFWMREAGR